MTLCPCTDDKKVISFKMASIPAENRETTLLETFHIVIQMIIHSQQGPLPSEKLECYTEQRDH